MKGVIKYENEWYISGVLGREEDKIPCHPDTLILLDEEYGTEGISHGRSD